MVLLAHKRYVTYGLVGGQFGRKVRRLIIEEQKRCSVLICQPLMTATICPALCAFVACTSGVNQFAGPKTKCMVGEANKK